MLDEVLAVFDIVPHHDLNVMTENQKLAEVTSRCLVGIDHVLAEEKPAIALAQGDTTTVLAVALACYYRRVPFAHVEAGLRTSDKFAPFPEEINRRLAGGLADLHFAPTAEAGHNLGREGVSPASIYVVGNSVVDAVLKIASRPAPSTALMRALEAFRCSVQRTILVTAHRRESFGTPLRSICHALEDLVRRHSSLGLIYPGHPNPSVRRTVEAMLGGRERILLTQPVDYVHFVHLMKGAHLILTDSGGVQEEAPSLGKPVLVMRDKTERPEGIRAGVARLVGTDRERIVEEVSRLLDSPEEYGRMVAASNPYGDGAAGPRIAVAVERFLGERP